MLTWRLTRAQAMLRADSSPRLRLRHRSRQLLRLHSSLRAALSSSPTQASSSLSSRLSSRHSSSHSLSLQLIQASALPEQQLSLQATTGSKST